MRRVIVLGIIIIICFILQTTIVFSNSLYKGTPNFLLFLTMSLGLLRGRKEGMLVGFTCGFFLDIFFGQFMGIYMFIYMIIGYSNGFFHKKFLIEDVLLPLILILINIIIVNTIIFLFVFLLKNQTDYFLYLKTIILPESLYTGILTIVAYHFIVKINKKIKIKSEGVADY